MTYTVGQPIWYIETGIRYMVTHIGRDYIRLVTDGVTIELSTSFASHQFLNSPPTELECILYGVPYQSPQIAATNKTE